MQVASQKVFRLECFRESVVIFLSYFGRICLLQESSKNWRWLTIGLGRETSNICCNFRWSEDYILFFLSFFFCNSVLSSMDRMFHVRLSECLFWAFSMSLTVIKIKICKPWISGSKIRSVSHWTILGFVLCSVRHSSSLKPKSFLQFGTRHVMYRRVWCSR